MRWPTWFPPLARTHPNFFLLLGMGTFVFHVYEGWVGIFGSDAEFSSSSLNLINAVAPHQAWGVAHVLIGSLIFAGLYPSLWRVAKWGLLLGFLLIGFRLSFLASTYLTGDLAALSSPGYLWFAAVAHLSQLMEPPTNPETQYRRR
jgi:hypothetical protein